MFCQTWHSMDHRSTVRLSGRSKAREDDHYTKYTNKNIMLDDFIGRKLGVGKTETQLFLGLISLSDCINAVTTPISNILSPKYFLIDTLMMKRATRFTVWIVK